MTRLRLLFAWLLLAALPLQGFAAASMLPCLGHPAMAAAVVMAPDAAHHAPNHAVQPASSEAASHEAAAGHSCAACAACCHAPLLTHWVTALTFPAPTSSDPAQHATRLQSRVTPVLDKPPRMA